jgi:hypothetical protein
MIKIIRLQRGADKNDRDDKDEMIKIIRMQRWDDKYHRDDRDEMISSGYRDEMMNIIGMTEMR